MRRRPFSHGQSTRWNATDFRHLLRNCHSLGSNSVLSSGLGEISCARGGIMLRRPILLSIDLLLVVFATVMAIWLRGDIGQEIDFTNFIPFVSISVGVASIIFFLGGLDRSLWRYSSIPDYSQIVVLSVLVVLTTFVFTFAVNRLHGIARSLLILQLSL